MSVNSQYASALRELKTKQAHLLEEVGDQWRTPEDLFWGINAVFGPFDMDLFTDGDNAHCARYYTAEDNALTQDWTADLNGGKGFANPPYSRPCKDEDGNDMTGMITIMNKAKAERDQGAKLAFLIRGVPSETWWPEQADHICFIKGRVGFKLPDWFIPANDKQKASSAGFAGAIAIFDKEWRGGPISYIHRDSLRGQGKKLLDMIEAAAEKKAATHTTGTIEARPNAAEQGEPIIAPQVSAQIDIEEQIAREPVAIACADTISNCVGRAWTDYRLSNSRIQNWELIDHVGDETKSEFESLANQLLLGGATKEAVITAINQMIVNRCAIAEQSALVELEQSAEPANSVWPIEVLNVAKEVFALCGIEKPTEIQFQELCEEANRQRLEGNSTDSIIDDLVMNMPTETKSCAA